MARILNRSKHFLTVAGVTIPPGDTCEVPGWAEACKSGAVKLWARAGLLVLAAEPVAEPPQPAQPEPEPEAAAEPAQAAAELAEPAATSERGWLSWR
jgi:hypothetical protein